MAKNAHFAGSESEGLFVVWWVVVSFCANNRLISIVAFTYRPTVGGSQRLLARIMRACAKR